MSVKRGIGVVILLVLFVALALFGSSQGPDFGSLPPPPAFPGAVGENAPAPGPDFGQLPQPPAFPGAAAPAPVPSPPVTRSLPGDISGPNGVADGRCVNLYDVWAMGPQVGVCQLPAGSPLDTNGDGCFTDLDIPIIMQSVNVRCS